MGCACNQRGRTQYEVTMDAGRGRVAFTSGSKPTATTVAGRYKGSAVRVKGSEEIVHHTETYEVTRSTNGPVVYAHSDLDKVKEHVETLETAYVRERETKEVVHTHPAALSEIAAPRKTAAKGKGSKAAQTAEAPA